MTKLETLYWELPKNPVVQWVVVVMTGFACAATLGFLLCVTHPRTAHACDPNYQTCAPGATVELGYCDEHPWICAANRFFRWIQEL